MNLVKNNPYRIVGLLVGATAAEQRRQLTRLQRFLEADQEPDDDFSFPTLGHFHRTLETVNVASSKLNLDSDKMSSALFWFYKGNPITDEPAFDAIKEADLDKVISIWTKLTSNGEVSQRNASAYSNLGTLYLSGILEGTNANEALLEQGISLKLKFLESDFVKDFKALATDETYKTTKKELQLLFLNQVQSEIEKSGGIISNKLLDILTKQEFSAKQDFMKGFVQKPIEQIEKKIEESKSKRKANKANAVNIGIALYEQTSENIKQLKSILGTTNLKFSSISDKVSDEILQCGIDYFSHFKDSSTDPGRASMELFRKAKTLAVGNIAKQRCEENTENLQEWIDDKPERDKQRKIKKDLDYILQTFNEFDNNLEDTNLVSFSLWSNPNNDSVSDIEKAKKLLNKCKPKLNNIKAVLGSSDSLYLKLSTQVAVRVQSNIIEGVNNSQETSNLRNSRNEMSHLLVVRVLKETLLKAWDVTNMIGTLDLEYDFKKNRYEPNKKTLRGLCAQLGVDMTTPRERLKTELDVALNEMTKIKEWQFLRAESERQRQIDDQQRKISNIQKQYNEAEY